MSKICDDKQTWFLDLMYNLQTRKKTAKKVTELKLTFLNIPTTKNLQYQHWP